MHSSKINSLSLFAISYIARSEASCSINVIGYPSSNCSSQDIPVSEWWPSIIRIKDTHGSREYLPWGPQIRSLSYYPYYATGCNTMYFQFYNSENISVGCAFLAAGEMVQTVQTCHYFSGASPISYIGETIAGRGSEVLIFR